MTKLFEGQKDTILSLVNEIYEKGDFVCQVKTPKEKKEIVIGQCTDYEKSLQMAKSAIADQHNKEVKRSKEAGEKLNENKVFLNHKKYEALSELFWVSIQSRLGEKAIESDVIRLRENWQIVACSITEEEPKTIKDLMASFDNFEL